MRAKRHSSRVFATLGESIIEKCKAALKDGADAVVEDAKSRVPVRTGKLQESIHAEPKNDGKEYRIVADAKNGKVYYGKLVEFSPKINHPFLYPALHAHEGEIKDRISKAIKEGSPHADAQ